MIELQKITTEVPPTGFAQTQQSNTTPTIEATLKQLTQSLNLDTELTYTFDQGCFTEKNKNNHITKILCDVLTMVLEQDETTAQTPNEAIIHKQNKKFIKESLIFLINSMRQYRLDDKKIKTYIAGKLIQSIYESKS